MAMRFIHVQQIVPYCLIPFVPFLGIPVPVTTETIHANKTIKIRSCYFSFSMCRSEKFDVSEIQDSCVGAHWGTPLFIRNEYVPTRVHVHNEMPSFSGRPRWTCRKIFNHVTQRSSCVIMEHVDHHTPRLTLLGFATRSWLAVSIKPSNLRAFGKEISPCRRTLWRHPFLHSLWIFQVRKNWSCQEQEAHFWNSRILPLWRNLKSYMSPSFSFLFFLFSPYIFSPHVTWCSTNFWLYMDFACYTKKQNTT